MAKNDSEWTFFSNYGHVYFLVSIRSEITARDIANEVGITERAVSTILNELVEGGYLEKIKVGRSNHYKPAPNKTLRHPLEKHVKLKNLLEIFQGKN